ncbi:hypothetical protein VTK56DRAFT_588 [Thermocarpiscus australiensis]
MEWSFDRQPASTQVPDLAVDDGHDYGTLSGMAASSPDGSADEFALGSAALSLSHMLPWDIISRLGSTESAEFPPTLFSSSVPESLLPGAWSAAGAADLATIASDLSHTGTRCTHHPANNPCIAAVATAVAVLHIPADVCLSSSPPSSYSSSSSSSSTSSSVSPPPAATTSTTSTAASSASSSIAPQGVLSGRTVDAILTAGRDAVAAVSAGLACGPCSCRPRLHLLAATALEKVVAWYRALVASMMRRTSGSAKGVASTTGAETLNAGDEILAAAAAPAQGAGATVFPIAIRSHQVVEEALQTAILAQVVLHRLRQLQDVVELLARRMGDSPPPPPPSSSSSSGGSQRLPSAEDAAGNVPRLPKRARDKLVARVRQHLVAAWEEIAIMLREDHVSHHTRRGARPWLC